MKYIIDKTLSSKVLMAGNYYKNHHPGGISAVVQYWSENIEDLQYYATWKLGGVATRAWWFGKSYVEIFFRLLLDKKIRIVHLHFAADGSFWRKEKLLRMAKMFGKKVVMHCHSSRFKDFYSERSDDGKRNIVDTLNKADVLIALSESWKEWFISVGVVASKIVVLHNITAQPQVRPTCKVNDGKVHMLFMGELGMRKGVFDIIRGLAKHCDELEGKLEFRIGGNTNEDRLMREIEEGGLNVVNKMIVSKVWLAVLVVSCCVGWFMTTFGNNLDMAQFNWNLYYYPNLLFATAGTYVFYLISLLISKKNGLISSSLAFLGKYSLILVCFPVIETYVIPFN